MTEQERWSWMMAWCKANRAPPANEHFWAMAGKACDEFIASKAKGEKHEN